SKKPLSAAALRHGEEQVRAMLRDRPAMAKYVRPGDVLWQWAVRKFAGGDVGVLGYWNSMDPSPQASDSIHSRRFGRFTIFIRGTGEPPEANRPRSFDELWSNVVFELHNVASRFPDHRDRANSDRVTSEEYNATSSEEAEIAAQKTRAFYLR